MDKVNLMTMKWGTKFPPEYPNLIHRMAKKHMPCEFTSYCMTEILTLLLLNVLKNGFGKI